MTSRFPARTTSDLSVSSWGKPASAGIGVVAGYGVATGGTSSTITVGGFNYTLLTFTSDGTLTVTTAGLFDFLVIGSGGGSSGLYNGKGGGGAGQLIEGTAYFSANQTVRVGAGGAYTSPNSGVSRIGAGIFALAGASSDLGNNGTSGFASGSGGAGSNSAISGGSAAINGVTGYAGGNVTYISPPYPGAGGGGMGGAGGNATTATPGTPGAGVSNSFNSTATTYCTGGFGGTTTQSNVNATANTGNGGGPSSNTYGAGGSGLVMVRFRI